MKDRLPPHDEEAEKCIIGSCLSTPAECLPEAQRIITTPEFFYAQKFRAVWESMQEMAVDKVDLISVNGAVKGGKAFGDVDPLPILLESQEAVPSTANLPVWLSIVQTKFLQRKIIQTCTNAIADAYQFKGEDAAEILDTVERNMLAIRPASTDGTDMRALVHEAIGILERKFNHGDQIMGLSTGLADLDRQTDGMHGGEMIVLAGFPSTGKTALAVNIAVHNAQSDVPVAVISAEMQPVKLVVRSICSNARANYHHLRDDRKALERMSVEAARMVKAKLHIEAAHGWTIGQVVASLRRLKQKYGIRLAVIDYIQLLTGKGDNREQEISSISKAIKAVAGELDIAVIALSQLNDDGKLRESRAIGQDADSIWKLTNDGDKKPAIQPIALEIEKCRDGEIGKVPLTFMKIHTRFENAAKVSSEDVPDNHND